MTKPLTFAGRELHLNVSTGAAGSVAVGILDAEGDAIPGFGAEDCQAFTGDEIDRVIRWKDGGDVSQLAGKPVRLRLVLKDADVYSLEFWELRKEARRK